MQCVIEQTRHPSASHLCLSFSDEASILASSFLNSMVGNSGQCQGYLAHLCNPQNSATHFKPLIEWSSWRPLETSGQWDFLLAQIHLYQLVRSQVLFTHIWANQLEKERVTSRFWMFQHTVSRLSGKQEVMMGNSWLSQVIQLTDARKWERGRRSNVLIFPLRRCSNDNFLPLGCISKGSISSQ